MKSLRVLAIFLLFAVQTVAHSAAYDDFISAVKRGDAVEVGSWLKRGMDPNTLDPTGMPVLHLAARDGSLEAVKVILGAGATILRTGSAPYRGGSTRESAGSASDEAGSVKDFNPWALSGGFGARSAAVPPMKVV